MTAPTTGWGASKWGGDPWGGSPLGGFIFQGAVAIAENVVRCYFSEQPYFSALLDPLDASLLTHYAVEADASTKGIDATPPRSSTRPSPRATSPTRRRPPRSPGPRRSRQRRSPTGPTWSMTLVTTRSTRGSWRTRSGSSGAG